MVLSPRIKIYNHDFQQAPKIEQINDGDGNRKYRVPSGKLYTSVTTFLGSLPNPGLDSWRERVGNKYADNLINYSTDRGSAVHKHIEQYLLNHEPERMTNPLYHSIFQRMLIALHRIDNIKLLETGLYSDRLRLAGTPDCIAEYINELCVIDFKTSLKMKEEKWIGGYFMQCGAYGLMYEEIFGVLPKKGVIIIGVEDSNLPQVFVKPMNVCVAMLKSYARDLREWRDGNTDLTKIM